MSKYPTIEIRLSGRSRIPDNIISRVMKALKLGGASKAEVSKFREEALAGDYKHVVETVKQWIEVT